MLRLLRELDGGHLLLLWLLLGGCWCGWQARVGHSRSLLLLRYVLLLLLGCVLLLLLRRHVLLLLLRHVLLLLLWHILLLLLLRCVVGWWRWLLLLLQTACWHVHRHVAGWSLWWWRVVIPVPPAAAPV